MVGFFVKHVRGPIVGILTLCMLAYGGFLFALLPLWGDLQAAAGGRELQETPFFSGARAAEVIGAYDAADQQTARSFYALDTIFVLLTTVTLAALIGFSLRHLRRERSLLRWLIVLPLALGVFDLMENGLLALMLQNGGGPQWVGTIAGIATGLKVIAGAAAILATLALLFIAGMINVRRQLEDPTPGARQDPS